VQKYKFFDYIRFELKKTSYFLNHKDSSHIALKMDFKYAAADGLSFLFGVKIFGCNETFYNFFFTEPTSIMTP
jgi:hypothetical protein